MEHQLLGLYVSFFIIGAGMAAPQHATGLLGRVPEQFPRYGEVRVTAEGAEKEEHGDMMVS